MRVRMTNPAGASLAPKQPSTAARAPALVSRAAWTGTKTTTEGDAPNV